MQDNRILMMEEDISIVNDWMESQRSDPELAALIDYKERSILPDDPNLSDLVVKEDPHYVLEQGVLCRIVYNKEPQSVTEKLLRVVVPKSKVEEILYDMHDDPFAGHKGVKKTFHRTCQQYYWKGMWKDIKDYVSLCVTCQRAKASVNQRVGMPQTMPIPKEPMEMMGVDFVGPFQTTGRGNKYILVFVDHFTRWAETFATTDMTATTVAQLFLDRIVCRFGAPLHLLSDRGKQFIGEVMEEVLRLTMTKALRTSGYHPQTNGVVERFNKSLVASLRALCNADPNNWDEALALATFSWNTSVHESTHYTPFSLMYGRDPEMGTDIHDHLQSEVEGHGLYEEYFARLAEARKIRQDLIIRAEENNKRKRENELRKKAVESKLQVGDLVWLYTPHVKKGKASKLSYAWQGPFRIAEFLGPVTVKLKTTANRYLKQPVHLSRLKEYKTALRPNTQPTLDDTDIFDYEIEDVDTKTGVERKDIIAKEKKKRAQSKERVPEVRRPEVSQEGESDDQDVAMEDESEVEAIVAVRVRPRDNSREYQVKWRDEQSSANSWISEADTSNCREKVEEFYVLKGLICNYCGYHSVSRSGSRNHMRESHPDKR
jgi:transposase InsO family protein